MFMSAHCPMDRWSSRTRLFQKHVYMQANLWFSWLVNSRASGINPLVTRVDKKICQQLFHRSSNFNSPMVVSFLKKPIYPSAHYKMTSRNKSNVFWLVHGAHFLKGGGGQFPRILSRRAVNLYSIMEMLTLCLLAVNTAGGMISIHPYMWCIM